MAVVTEEQVRELRMALKLVQRRLRREAGSVGGVSRTALQVFGALARAGEASPGEVAEQLRMTTSNVAAALRELDAAGYIDRCRDPHDRRRTRVTLTRRGSEAVRRLRAERDTWFGRAIAAELSDAEQAVLVRAGRLLARVAAHERPASRAVADRS